MIKRLGVWGFSTDAILKYRKRYRVISLGVYAIDILAVFSSGVLMYKYGSKLGTCISIVIGFTIACSLFLSIFSKEDLTIAYKLYKKALKKDIKVLKLRVTPDDLCAELNKLNVSSMSNDLTLDNYASLINETCREDNKFATKVMKLLVLLPTPDEDSNFFVYYTTINKKRTVILASAEDIELNVE